MGFNEKQGRLGFYITSREWNGKFLFRYILTENGQKMPMESGSFFTKTEAERAAEENIDYLCERFNYTKQEQ